MLENIKFKIKKIIILYSNKFGIDLDYILKSSIWNSSNQLMTIIFGIILSIFLARTTSTEVFGDYYFLLSIITMLSIISMPGLNISLVKSVSRGKDGIYTESVKLSFLWSLIGIPVLLLIGLYYYFFGNNLVGIALLLAAIFFPFFYAPNNWQYLLIGKERFDLYSKRNMTQTLIISMFIIISVIIGKGSLIPIFITYMLFNAFFNTFYYFQCKKFVENDAEEEGWKNSGYQLTFIEFTLFAYDNIDKIIIGILLGPSQLAIYVIAVTVVNLLRGSFSQIFQVITPKIMKMEKELINYHLKRLMPKFIIFNIILLIFIIIILPFIIKLFYSEKYIQSIYYAQIYTLTIPLAFIMTITSNIIVAHNKENILLKLRIVGTIVLLSLYVLLIPLLGLIGAIISSIIYYIFIDILQYFYSTKSRNY